MVCVALTSSLCSGLTPNFWKPFKSFSPQGWELRPLGGSPHWELYFTMLNNPFIYACILRGFNTHLEVWSYRSMRALWLNFLEELITSILVLVLFEQKKLIMVGSCRSLSKVPLLKLLIEKVEEQSGMLIVSNKDFNINAAELKRCSNIKCL